MNLSDFVSVMPASDMLDEELNAIRGGMGGDIIIITCKVGRTPSGFICNAGEYTQTIDGGGNFNGGGVNTDGQGNNPGGKKP